MFSAEEDRSRSASIIVLGDALERPFSGGSGSSDAAMLKRPAVPRHGRCRPASISGGAGMDSARRRSAA
jgi:hypothetical protein